MPALVLGVLAVTGVAQVWHVYVLAFVFGIGSAFDAPARQSFVSEMVGPDDLTNAVGLNSRDVQPRPDHRPGARRPADRRPRLGAARPAAVILINARQLRRGDPGAAARCVQPSSRRATPVAAAHGHAPRGRALRAAAARDLMLILVIVFFAGTFGLNFQITSALMATQVFRKGAGEYGLLGSAMAIGSLAGALLAARRGRIRLAAA